MGKRVSYAVIHGDALAVLRAMPESSINCCVTSPPYWGLRDYGVAGQIGLEPTPREFVGKLVDVFREVRRVLTADGTCWVNLGDSYVASATGGLSASPSKMSGGRASQAAGSERPDKTVSGLPAKNLVGIPWRVAFALQADGWWLRQDIIWAKPNPMPESVQDRCTKAHEYLFLLTKSAKYFWDAGAMREPATDTGRINQIHGRDEIAAARPPGSNPRTLARLDYSKLGRNKRSVWTIPTMATPEAHFATYPLELAETCILAGCPEGGLVLDPFSGAGTTGLAALKNGRRYVGIEISADYVKLAEERARKHMPLLVSNL